MSTAEATSTVTPIHAGGRMTEAEYDKQRAALRETYGDSKQSANARREQELARLFIRSSWSEEQLAKKEGITLFHMRKLLTFGRFLNFMPSVAQVQLSEGEFRRYWSRSGEDDKVKVTDSRGKTSYNERQRFIVVQRLIEEEKNAEKVGKRPSIARDIVKEFADGKWHSIETIAKKLDTTVDHAQATIQNQTNFSKYATSENKPVGKSHHYRIFKKEKTVGTEELTTKLKPIVEALIVEGKKSIVTMSPPTVAHLAHQLSELLDEWTE